VKMVRSVTSGVTHRADCFTDLIQLYNKTLKSSGRMLKRHQQVHFIKLFDQLLYIKSLNNVDVFWRV